MNGARWRRRDWLGMAPALMLVSPTARAQGTPAQPASLPGATVQDLRHAGSGHTWRVWLQRPGAPPPAGGYPVLWLLDGNASFSLAAQLARNDEARPEALRGEGLVVVAVGHPSERVYSPAERLRDYTPLSAKLPNPKGAGGADHLLDFMLADVRCWLPADLRLDPKRHTLFGHSLAGLFVLHTWLTRPGAFTRCAAASPSIWWNGAEVLHALDGFERRIPAPTVPVTALELQLRVGALETPQAAATPARAAIQRDRRMIDNARTVAERLTALHRPGLSVDFEVYAGLDHGAVMVHALIDALDLAQRPLA